MVFDLVHYWGHPAVVKKMSLFMLTERVDPSALDSCILRAQKAEKEALDAKVEVAKMKDKVETWNRAFKTMENDIKVLKAKK
jgi:hypothetical protein